MASKSLFPTLLAPSVACPYVVAGTKGMAFSRHWYVDLTEVTRSAAIGGRNLEECVDKRKKKRGNNTRRTTDVSRRSDTEVPRKDNEMQCELRTGMRIR